MQTEHSDTEKPPLLLSQRWKTTQAIIQHLMAHHDTIRREMLAAGEVERTDAWPLPDWMRAYPAEGLADFIGGALSENIARLTFFEDLPLLSHRVVYLAGESACQMQHRLQYAPSYSA